MIENLFKRTFVVSDYRRTLLGHFQDNHIDWMHACGGKGRCTTCKVIVVRGGENFEAPTKAELGYFREGALKEGERLACQAKIHGDVSLRVPAEYRLDHVTYSDDR